MYWPIGTPRIYATSNTTPSESTQLVSHDGLPPRDHVADRRHDSTSSYLSAPGTAGQDAPTTPLTPVTPQTPGIKPVEHDYCDGEALGNTPGATASTYSPKEPILALRVARAGHIFAVITSTSMTIWQTKPTVVLAIVVRSESSIKSYGTNIGLLLRPDAAIFVVHTSLGYLITYSIATDAESRVYKPHFTSHTNIQKRRQSHAGGPGQIAPDQILWGPGEGSGVRDVSVRFRMVIKVDAGIESALALDDELVVATAKPAAVQCIRWTPDEAGGDQTRTELLSRMGWVDKKVVVKEMTHDRPMSLSTWITNDGKGYAVQRLTGGVKRGVETDENPNPRKLFNGYCFHVPKNESEHAVRCIVNARFSLISVGCVDGSIRVYSAKDYSGNIPPSHIHTLPVSRSAAGRLTTISYSADGYCLFAGYEKGWATWSVFGKPLSNSFYADHAITAINGEEWISGVLDAVWIGGGCELLLAGRNHEAIWMLEMARSAVTGCYSSANLFRTVLQNSSSVMVYRGYDLPDLTSISAEPGLWHISRIPALYLTNQWPIKCTAISSDGRYVAVAGRRGLAHYSISSGRWKTFANQAMEDDFIVRGGMCWYQNILVAAVEANRSYELRLYSREAALDNASMVFTQPMPAPIVLITPSGEDSLLVYTYDNLLYHFVFSHGSGAVRLVEVGHIAFHGIVRSPARVRGLSWILPESQLMDGDPSQDVAHASVLFLVDGKLVLLRPSLSDGVLKYDMRVIVHNIEFYTSMRDQPFLGSSQQTTSRLTNGEVTADDSLQDSLWIFDGRELKAWTDVELVLKAISGETTKELPPMISIPIDFYPLSVLLSKAIVLGVESDLIQRRDVNFSFFRFTIRTHLFLSDILRFYLTVNRPTEALRLAQEHENLEYFAHGLEILLHHVLDEEVDANPPPAPQDAILPRVLSLLSSFKQYLDIVVQCTRKTEVRSWRTLFAYLPPPQELFEESLQRGSLKTAGGYLLILHTFDELATASEQSVRLLSRAMREEDWELCKELARFLAALDESGDTLREAMEMVNARAGAGGGGSNGNGNEFIMARLEVPQRGSSTNGSPRGGGIGSPVGIGPRGGSVLSDSDVDGQTNSDAGSVVSTGTVERYG